MHPRFTKGGRAEEQTRTRTEAILYPDWWRFLWRREKCERAMLVTGEREEVLIWSAHLIVTITNGKCAD